MQSKFKKNFVKGHTLDIFHVILGYPDTKQHFHFLNILILLNLKI